MVDVKISSLASGQEAQWNWKYYECGLSSRDLKRTNEGPREYGEYVSNKAKDVHI
ncbi:hypothetical protein Hanom_Chr06g00549611 [Helianthus anomalus]